MRKKLVLLALDAGDVEWIERWAEQGHLPTIKSIMQSGCWGRISGPELITEHGSWVSAFSGSSRPKHNYFSFRQLKPRSYDLIPFAAQDADALPFWCRLKDGLKAMIIDPPDQGLKPGKGATQLCHWASHQPAIPHMPPASDPPELLDEALRVFGPQIPLPEFAMTSSTADDKALHAKYLDRIQRKGRLVRQLIKRDDFDLIVAGFHESHTGAHRFWGASGEQSSQDSLDYIREIYSAIDREFGLLLKEIGGNPDVFVLSVYGMKSSYPMGDIVENFCRKLKYHIPIEAAPKKPSFSPISIARAVMPQRLRAAISKRLPPGTQEKLLASGLRDQTDWSRTRAFAIPFLYIGLIRINLRGREPNGIVAPGQEYLDLLTEIEQNFRALVDPKTGQPAVEQITRTIDLFPPDPPLHMPDLFVDFKKADHFIDRLIHPQCELHQPPPKYFRGSEHSHFGFLAASGPSIIGRGKIGDMNVPDLAPTWLSLLDGDTSGLTGRRVGIV